MNNGWMMFGLGCLLAAALVVLADRYRQKKIIDGLRKMIDQAMNGNFTENSFTESRQSALENRLAQYVAASELSARNVAAEKDKIKALIADISHQTKTPVANLLLYTELLQETDLNPEAREYVDFLQVQASKLRFLIASLVKLSRLETGILALHPEKREVLPMVEELVETYRIKAESKGLSLGFSGEENVDKLCAVFDEKWTGEAIGNILDNAVKYTDEGTVIVRIKSYELFTCIEISDTGRGIPEEEQGKIFQRFYRSTEVSAAEGVGIGLHLARQILRQEGGFIKVSSRPGRGSTFGLYIPNS